MPKGRGRRAEFHLSKDLISFVKPVTPTLMNVRKVLLSIFFIAPSILFANGIAVSSVSIASQNTTEKYKMIKLNVAWSNSWRTY